MGEDDYTEVTSQSWFSRLGGAIGGVVVGLIIFIIGFPLLFWNEGNYIKSKKALQEGAGAVVSLSIDKVEPGYQGKLVHLTGTATTGAKLADPVFGITINAIKLKRIVKMYQWKETEKKETAKETGGGTTTKTTYTYAKVWNEGLIDSRQFKKPQGHANPSAMALTNKESVAKEVKLGAYALSPGLVDKINKYEELPANSAASLPSALQGKVTLDQGNYYVGQNPQSPEIGDLKIEFQVIKPLTISMVAKQIRNTFEPYIAANGKKIELLSVGTVSAANMFQEAQKENQLITWLLRLLGFLLFFIGLLLIFRPLSVFMDVLPILGSIAQTGITMMALPLALALALITISIGWLSYRPVVGVPLILAALGLIWGIRKLRRQPPPAPAAPQ